MLKLRLDYMIMSYQELSLYLLGNKELLNGCKKEKNKILKISSMRTALEDV